MEMREVTIYACKTYDVNRLCRFDRRAIDTNCAGCPRTTDAAYLQTNGLWVPGISHAVTVAKQGDQNERFN
jgi:hypothetical protein